MQIRDWIYVEDHCRGLMDALENGKPGEVYNMGGGAEMPNLHLVKTVLKILGKSESLITFVKDRPGHDRRYAMDSSKIRRELGWEAKFMFEEAMQLTVQWYLDHRDWVASVTSGAYREYYQQQYGDR
jgi:dTDP-glucose 4,6-dehydratase